MELVTENKDLVWELGGFHQRKRAVDFAMGFENKICVYSASVEQLYTNYNIFFPKEEGRSLVILPNPYAHHDIFNGIPQSAVTPTGLSIIAGDMVQKEGLFLLVPSKTGKSRFRAVPLQTGLRVINQRRPAGKPLLPVLMKGDLRELKATTPSLHLHCLHLQQLEHMSHLEQMSIQKTILANLQEMT